MRLNKTLWDLVVLGEKKRALVCYTTPFHFVIPYKIQHGYAFTQHAYEDILVILPLGRIGF